MVPTYSRGIAVAGDYAYWVYLDIFSYPEYQAKLVVIDVTNPAAASVVGSVALEPSAKRVAVEGGHAYVAGDGLTVVDATAPQEPEVVGFLGGVHASNVAVSGGYAYTVGSTVRVIDVRTPEAPVEAGSLGTIAGATDVAIAGDQLYVASWRGLHVVDVSTPEAPVEIELYDAPVGWPAPGVAVAHGVVSFAAGLAGLVCTP